MTLWFGCPECGLGLMKIRKPLVLSWPTEPALKLFQVLYNPFVTHVVTTQPSWSLLGTPAPLDAGQRGRPQPFLLTLD